MSEGLKQSYFRKNLTGLQVINADQITAQVINIPNGLLNTSTIKCNYMNVCFIEYTDDYDKLITLEQEYNDGILTMDSERYKQLKNLRAKLSRNKNSGKNF